MAVKQPGDVVTVRAASGGGSALLPALLLRRVCAGGDAWLVCMIEIGGRVPYREPWEALPDEIRARLSLDASRRHFIRPLRLGVVEGASMAGRIGALPAERLAALRARIADWVKGW